MMPDGNGFVNMSVSSDVFRRLGQSRFQAYVDFVRNSGVSFADPEIEEAAMVLYRWNAEASAILMRYIPWIEVLVRNAIDGQLRLWLARQAPQSCDDWIDVNNTRPMDRVRDLINTSEKDYLSEARRTALSKKRFWKSDQSHPRHGDEIGRDDVFAQLTFGTWDGMLSRAAKDPELAGVLMEAFPNIEDAWESESCRMPNSSLPGTGADTHEDRLRRELVNRLKSIRVVRNRIGHDENLLRVNFPKIRHDMYFVLNSLGADYPKWAFPDKAEPLKRLNPLQVLEQLERKGK